MPTTTLHIVPAPERDTNGMPITYEEYNLNRDTLLEALTNVSNYIYGYDKHITMYVYFQILYSISAQP